MSWSSSRSCSTWRARASRSTTARSAIRACEIIGDARETLLTGRDRYDIIASEPSNPFRAGVASLFTQEFYRAAAARLTDEGVLAQWVQGYEIDAPTLRTIYATMASVFPQVEAWQTHRGDMVLLGSKRLRRYSARELAGRIATEPYRSALAHVWRAVDINAFLAHYIAADAVAREIARMPAVDVNTDDRNVVEFGFARSLGRPRALIVPELRRLAAAVGASRPPLSDDDGVTWPAVETARVASTRSTAASTIYPRTLRRSKRRASRRLFACSRTTTRPAPIRRGSGSPTRRAI